SALSIHRGVWLSLYRRRHFTGRVLPEVRRLNCRVWLGSWLLTEALDSRYKDTPTAKSGVRCLKQKPIKYGECFSRDYLTRRRHDAGRADRRGGGTYAKPQSGVRDPGRVVGCPRVLAQFQQSAGGGRAASHTPGSELESFPLPRR